MGRRVMEKRIKKCLNLSSGSMVVKAAFLLYFSCHRLENREPSFSAPCLNVRLMVLRMSLQCWGQMRWPVV